MFCVLNLSLELVSFDESPSAMLDEGSPSLACNVNMTKCGCGVDGVEML